MTGGGGSYGRGTAISGDNRLELSKDLKRGKVCLG